MDIDMPDADQADRFDTPFSLSPSASPDPPNSPAPSSDIDDHGDSENGDEPQQPDPNDLYKGDIKTYDSTTLVIVDAEETGPVYSHEANESIHKHNAHLVEIAFRETSNFAIRKICLAAGSVEDDFKREVDNILAGKTARDLMIWHYHGSAGGVESGYKWRFQGSPRGINAYDFIGKLCNSAPGSMLLLDCYIHNKLAQKWKLKTGNVEIITLQCKIQNGAGNIIHAHDGYLTERVCRNLRKWLGVILRLDEFKVANRAWRSIPHTMGRDKSFKPTSIRIWLSRTGKDYSELCLRIMLNPLRVWQEGKIVFESECIGPPRPPPVVVLPPSEMGEDEGYEEMEDSVVGDEGEQQGGRADGNRCEKEDGAGAADDKGKSEGDEDDTGGLFV